MCLCGTVFCWYSWRRYERSICQSTWADENLTILQDIIRENECQAGMAFLGYTYEGAEAAEILEYTRQGEVAAAYPFYRMEQWLMQGDMRFMPLSRG